MSLLELLLVLGLLATVVAISWPALRRPLNRSFVQTAAQELQRVVTAARFQAMDRGVVQVFQYRAGTSEFWIGETIQDDADAGAFAKSRKYESTDRRGTTEAYSDTKSLQSLPAGTSFQPEQLSLLTESKPNSKADSGEALSIASAEGRWSRPVRFYPSGRMDSAQLTIESDDQYAITLDIQGLAGRIRITDLRRSSIEEEIKDLEKGEARPNEQPTANQREGKNEMP